MQTGSSGPLIGWISAWSPLFSLFGTEWRERGYGLKELLGPTAKSLLKKAKIFNKMKDVINSLCHE
jgi:hypothetical protein